MLTMKCDMAGAGAVLGVMSVLTRLAPQCRVTGYLCITENMPGPSAFKLLDVLTARNGKTVEIHNTDAEGRLVLMDGLSLAVEDKADAIIDLATLTGAAIVALGNDMCALLSNHPAFRTQILDASERAGEDMWHLPLYKKYRKHLDSSIADMKNIGHHRCRAVPGGVRRWASVGAPRHRRTGLHLERRRSYHAWRHRIWCSDPD
jgi:leucyl aminopeptidase